ncbi:MAG TPA: MarR family transcriptional regulator, partial [Allosphingosinicella sp.]|nr:MarR family transcriptional regulator [Allosphingosinicella sp.]
TMSRIVDALLKQGLVVREAAAEDRRSVRISATGEGRRVMEAGRERRLRALLRRLDRLSADERVALARGVELLERILR